MNNAKTIDVLNTLIEINNDRIEGYKTASNETEDYDIKTLFTKFSSTSQKCEQELAKEIHNLQGIPTKETNFTSKMHRVWMDIKSTFTGQDLQAILNSCEYGDSSAVKTYEDVLSNHIEDISTHQKTMIEAQYLLIRDEHDRIEKMIESLKIITE